MKCFLLCCFPVRMRKILIFFVLCLSFQALSEDSKDVLEPESYVLLDSKQLEDQTQREYWFVPDKKVLLVKIIYPDLREEIIETKPLTEEEILKLGLNGMQ